MGGERKEMGRRGGKSSRKGSEEVGLWEGKGERGKEKALTNFLHPQFQFSRNMPGSKIVTVRNKICRQKISKRPGRIRRSLCDKELPVVMRRQSGLLMA